jgi:hypothetical protein
VVSNLGQLDACAHVGSSARKENEDRDKTNCSLLPPTSPSGRYRLVASTPSLDLFIHAKDLFVEAMIPADVTDDGAAQRILADVRPEVLVLNASAKPRMGRLDQLSWADFTATWETDVKAGLYWMQAAAVRARRRAGLERRGLRSRLYFRAEKSATIARSNSASAIPPVSNRAANP